MQMKTRYTYGVARDMRRIFLACLAAVSGRIAPWFLTMAVNLIPSGAGT
jgi:hypothetical protein